MAKKLIIEYYKDFYSRTCIFALILSGTFYCLWNLFGIKYDEVFLFGYSLGFALISVKIESLIINKRIKKLEDIITISNETNKPEVKK